MDAAMAAELGRSVAESARFRAFVAAHRDKIRKKLRGATDEMVRRDVRAELRVAELLLADRRIELAFEAYGSGKLGPDFTVTVGAERPFNLEVTRIHGEPQGGGWVLLAKLRQLPPGAANAVLLSTDGDSVPALDVGASVRWLRARADAKDEEFFTSRGFDGSRGFYQRFLRLGGVFVWCEQAVDAPRATLWTNGSARIALPERSARACLACLQGAPT